MQLLFSASVSLQVLLFWITWDGNMAGGACDIGRSNDNEKTM
jgi:hypothetical protein